MKRYRHKGKTVVAVGDMVELEPLWLVTDIRRCPIAGHVEVQIGTPRSHMGAKWIMLEECRIHRKAARKRRTR